MRDGREKFVLHSVGAVGFGACCTFGLEQRLAFGLCGGALGDVASDFRGADDAALRVANRRDSERDVDFLAVLAATDGFEMIDASARANFSDDFRHFIFASAGGQHGNWFADRFVGLVAKYPFGATVPTGNDAIERLGDDGVVGGFDDRG